jgi:hypothetical protein
MQTSWVYPHFASKSSSFANVLFMYDVASQPVVQSSLSIQMYSDTIVWAPSADKSLQSKLQGCFSASCFRTVLREETSWVYPHFGSKSSSFANVLFMYDVASQPVVGNDVASQPVASFGKLRTKYVIAEYWLPRRCVLSMVVA